MVFKNPKDFVGQSEYSQVEIEFFQSLREQPDTPLDVRKHDRHFRKLRRNQRKWREMALMVQSDGSSLRHAFPEDKGSQYYNAGENWYRTVSSARLYKPVKSKLSQPKLGLWSACLEGSNLILVAADFDVLPSGFTSFEELEDHLESKYGKKGIVLRTLRNKCKVLFQVKVRSPMGDHTAISKIALEHILTRELFAVCDLSKSALSIIFMTPKNVKLISSKLRTLKLMYDETIESIIDKRTNTIAPDGATIIYSELLGSDIVCNIKTTPLRMYEGPLEGPLSVYEGRSYEPLLRAIMSNPRYLQSKQINQKYFADGLEVDRTTICRHLKAMCKEKLLKRSKEKYKPKVCSYRYVARGELKKFLQSTAKVSHDKKLPLPLHIPDGEWNTQLFAVAASHFSGKHKEFLLWAQSLSGADEGDRPQKIKDIYNKIKKGRL